MDCEACVSAMASVSEGCPDGESVFRLCFPCQARLLNRALRPAEWYRLASRYGCWQFHLHDDFYDNRGNAAQSVRPVERPEDHSAPSLEQVESDPDSLFGFTVASWTLAAPVVDAWRRFPPDRVLGVVTRRYDQAPNRGVRAVALDLAGTVLGKAAREFVDAAWSHYPDELSLESLAFATAVCIESPRGFLRVVQAIENLDGRARREALPQLAHFQDPMALDWIERSVDDQVTRGWGELAAASRFEWQRALAWLAAGPPLSLVAFDALNAIANPRAPLLCEPRWQLFGKPRIQELERALAACQRNDPVPRVQRSVAAILGRMDHLGASGDSEGRSTR